MVDNRRTAKGVFAAVKWVSLAWIDGPTAHCWTDKWAPDRRESTAPLMGNDESILIQAFVQITETSSEFLSQKRGIWGTPGLPPAPLPGQLRGLTWGRAAAWHLGASPGAGRLLSHLPSLGHRVVHTLTPLIFVFASSVCRSGGLWD